MMEVVIYTRVSTEDQKDNGFSLQAQEHSIRTHCKREGKVILRHYQDDYSGKNFQRPEFKKFLDDLKSGAIKPRQFICVRADRFSRSLDESLRMTSILKNYGVSLYFVEGGNFDLSTPENLIPYIMNYALPQVENERRGLNTKKGMRQALKEGRWMGKGPKGYSNDKVHKTIVPNCDAHFIVEAFESVILDMKPIDVIRRELVKEGFECSKQNFYSILRNPVYKGIITLKETEEEPYQEVSGIHDPLISEQLFDEVQSLLNGKKRQQVKPSKYKNEFPLRGHLVCKECEATLTGSSSTGRSKRYAYYHCQNGCSERMKAESVNDEFLKFLGSQEISTEIAQLYDEILKSVFEENEGSKEQKIIKVEKEKEKESIKLSRLDDKLMDGEIVSDDYKRMTERVKSNIDTLDTKLIELEMTDSDMENHFKFGLRLLTNLKNSFLSAPIHVKHKIIGSMFPEKLIFDGKKYRTVSDNLFVSLITSNRRALKSLGTKKATRKSGLSRYAPPPGLEPGTL